MRVDRNILTNYFLGQCTEEEKEIIHQWLESDESHKKEFVRERIRFDASLLVDEQELLVPSQPVSQRKLLRFMQVAAAVLVLLGSSFLFQLYLYHPQETAFQNIYAPAGSRTSVKLPDGSSVWLNSNTSITYASTFTKEHRIIELDGEGYFEIIKDIKRPFIVKTQTYNVEVLGTTFDVEAYSNDPVFKTTLYSGKVRLYKDHQEEEALYLNPGETAELIGDHLQVKSADSYSYRWKDGLIVLEGQSFQEIMRLFEKYFDLHIVVQNENVRELGYEGKLRIVDGIDHALRVLQNDFRFTYHREAETNVLYIK